MTTRMRLPTAFRRAAPDAAQPRSTRPARTAAVLAWSSGVGFGLPGLYAVEHLVRHGDIATFMGYPTYGHGVFQTKYGIRTTVPLLAAFVAVCAAECYYRITAVAPTSRWRPRSAAPAPGDCLLGGVPPALRTGRSGGQDCSRPLQLVVAPHSETIDTADRWRRRTSLTAGRLALPTGARRSANRRRPRCSRLSQRSRGPEPRWKHWRRKRATVRWRTLRT